MAETHNKGWVMGKKFGLQGYNELVRSIKNYNEITYKEARQKYLEYRDVGLDAGFDKSTIINRIRFIVNSQASGAKFKTDNPKDQLLRTRFEHFAQKHGLEEELEDYVKGKITPDEFYDIVERKKIDLAKTISRYEKGD